MGLEDLLPGVILWGEGYLLSAVVAAGVASNVFLQCLIRNRELNLVKNFSDLLQMQALYDLLYLLCNVPAFVVPALVRDVNKHTLVPFMPAVLPTLHIFLTGSCYTTVSLALERLSAMKIPDHRNRLIRRRIRSAHVAGGAAASSAANVTTRRRCWKCLLPCLDADRRGVCSAFAAVLSLSVAINIPRFFEMSVGYHKEGLVRRINNTGNPLLDHKYSTRVIPHLEVSPHLSSTYFVYYNQLFSFLALTLVPSAALTVLNTLIYRRLQAFKRLSARLGREERKTVRATASLVCIVLFHLGCHSFKVVVNGYQVAQTVSAGKMVYTWPSWLELLTVASHVSLAANSSVNLLLYCACDKHFLVVAQKKLKLAFVWPFTIGRAQQLVGGGGAETEAAGSGDGRDGEGVNLKDQGEDDDGKNASAEGAADGSGSSSCSNSCSFSTHLCNGSFSKTEVTVVQQTTEL